MASTLDQAMPSESTGFKTWALIVGCMYASVTLAVVSMAVARVTAGSQTITGYTPPVALASAPQGLVGDFWPADARLPRADPGFNG